MASCRTFGWTLMAFIIQLLPCCYSSSQVYTYSAWVYAPLVINQTTGVNKGKLQGAFIDVMEHIVSVCSKNVTLVQGELIHDMKSLIDKPSDSNILLPISYSKTRLNLVGQNFENETFIPILESPGMWLILMPGDFCSFVNSILFAWPLIASMLALSLVSGFVMWVLERNSRRRRFPKEASSGIWEGAWWAIVTMATVGYGDRTPGTIIGRVYAVLWIMISIVVFSVFIAILSSASNWDNVSRPDIQGMKIGVYEGTPEYEYAYALGAEPVSIEMPQGTEDFNFKDDVAGYLVDNFRALYIADKLRDDELRVDYFFERHILHGILLKGIPDVESKCMVRASYEYHYQMLDKIAERTKPLQRHSAVQDKIKETLGNFKLLLYMILAHFMLSGLLVLIHFISLFVYSRCRKKKEPEIYVPPYEKVIVPKPQRSSQNDVLVDIVAEHGYETTTNFSNAISELNYQINPIAKGHYKKDAYVQTSPDTFHLSKPLAVKWPNNKNNAQHQLNYRHPNQRY